MRRPDVFTLDYSHPLAQGLAFAGFGEPGVAQAASPILPDSSLSRKDAKQTTEANRPSWLFDAELSRYAFDVGSNTSKIFVGQSPVLNISGAITLSAWQKLVAGRTNQPIFRREGYHVELGPFGVATRIYSGVAITAVYRPVGQSVADGVWTHVAMTYDGATQSVYLNGRLVGSQANAGVLPEPSYPFWYGGSQGWASSCSGVVADPCVFNRALSPAEIALLADRTDPMLGGLIVEERPVLYFDMGGSTTDNLPTPDSITTTPSLGSPALGQIHVLGGDGVAVTPVLGHPALAQVHVLSAPTGITVAPTLGHPALTEISNTDALSQPDGITIAPSLGNPALGQVHNLAAPDGITVTPVLGHPTLTAAAGVDSLPAPDGIVVSPVIGSPAIGQVHVLGGDGISIMPALGHPLLGQVHALAGADGMSVTAVLGHPVLSAFDVAAITADEVARVVRASSRMKTVSAASRMKQVRYAVS